MRKTRIVCTIGPASQGEKMIRELLSCGMNVARLNLSHGTREQHQKNIKTLRQTAAEMGVNLAILLDTKGPELRVGNLPQEPLVLSEGEQVVLSSKPCNNAKWIPVTYQNLAEEVKPGDKILLSDGSIVLSVSSVNDGFVYCRVHDGGSLSGGKHVNVPGVNIKLPPLSQKDIDDIFFGIKQGVDFFAISFVKQAADIIAVKRLIEESGGSQQVIAKIENRQGVDNIDSIIEVSHGIMVARGDLGVEIPPEEVPLVQKEIIIKCNRVGKPVITATQMLESMIYNARPTRAEASDVANAILDGTDAVMLSGETAVGKFPAEAVGTMACIAEKAESALYKDGPARVFASIVPKTVTDAISLATCNIALSLGAKAIITSTQTGYTARMVSKHRFTTPIIAATPETEVMRRLALVWGVRPLLVGSFENTDQMISKAIEVSLKTGAVKPGDLIVLTAGVPVGVPGTTNLIKVHTAGDPLN